MTKLLERILTPVATKQVLVVAEDPWLRFRLQRELERAGCRVTSVARLRPTDLAEPASYDVVLTDAAVFPEGSRLEALRALRASSPQARFVLLVGSGERQLADQARQSGFAVVLERPTGTEALFDVVQEALAESNPALAAVPVPIRFQFVLQGPAGEGKRQVSSAFISFVVHSLIVAVAVLIPLMYTETLNLRELTNVWLVAPPPPPPPPPPPLSAAMAARRVRPQTLSGKLVAPTVIPKEIARIVELTDIEFEQWGVLGGVPGGVPGGQLGGVLGGVLGGIPSASRPVVAPPTQAPIRVGGKLRPPRLIRRVEPTYPGIAKQARLQGQVRIDAIIDTSGRVVEMRILSGHPLLVKAALEGVEQWLYEPTYLNEQPVPVVLEVTVYFRLQ